MGLNELIGIVARLRGPGGCPWDKDQNRESLKPFLVEELYELIDAIDDNDIEGIKEELGDLLFQIVFHCHISGEEGAFDINDVIDGISRKMVDRHPHVFADKDLKTSADVVRHWEEHKESEQKNKNRRSLLDRIPRALPALSRAQRLQEKASEVGFDWDNIADVLKKLDEEITEFKDALKGKSRDEIEDEIGDMLFVMVRTSNFVNVDPEDALRRSIAKFIHRFNYMETEASGQGRKLTDMTLEEMGLLWDRAKKENS